jgi:small nuclear ribonucleoprotein (snRNP)-like protein
VTFTLNNVTYHATPDLPGHALLTAASLQGASPIQQMQSMGTFLDLCLLPESRELFEANMRSTDPSCNITLEDAAEVVKWLLEEVYVGRPTQAASGSRGAPSPDGSSTTDTASSTESTPSP